MTAHVAVIGTGYVGLTTGAYLAHLGHHVVCADVIEEKVALLNDGEVPFFEAGLHEMVHEGIAGGRLRFVLGAATAVPGAEFVFLCLPTPQSEDGSADLSYIEGVAAEIGPHLEAEAVVITKSTVPVGTTTKVARLLARDDVFVVANPEFLREGSALHDCLHPDRIVIGSDDQEAAMRVASLFEHLEAPLIVTNPASAEAIKYSSNAFLATKVSFINAIAHLCELFGADVRDVALGMGYDKRIGFEFLRPGPGFGGSCFPKDSRALIRMADDVGYDFEVLRGVVDMNERQFAWIADKIAAALRGPLDGKTIAVWGLTFKARTDDLRESPALHVIDHLLERGATIRAFDPMVKHEIDGITVCGDAYAACDGADALAVLTEWDDFRWLDFDKVAEAMATRIVVDARNLLDPTALRRRGFSYDGIGRV
ncbi:MAG TPA: UDP-glucose/GDP-mannose dehydrogenase family protein [Acidimicrobiales bacterium]|nr:UDP-glucose/GDP-mannose dehydrogenase family protein [Acidimicrobiales bacterium]